MSRKLQLPLPPGFFRTPPLTDDERLACIAKGQRALLALVRACRLHGGPIAWTFDHASQGVAVYRGFADNAIVQMCITEVQATLEEAAYLVSVGVDGSQDYCATFYPDHIVDVQPLYKLAVPNRHHPHNSMTLKWRALQAPFLATRDFCCLEYQDDFTIDGMVGFGRCLKSVDLPNACPNLERSFGLLRGDIRLGGDVFYQSRRPGYITVCRLYDVDLKGHAWLSSSHLYAKSQLTKGLNELDRQFRQQRMNNSAYLPEYTLVPRHTRSHCALCHSKLTVAFLARKFNCHKCGEVVCHRCHRTFYVPGYPIAGQSRDGGRLTTLFKSQTRDRTSMWTSSSPAVTFMTFRVCHSCSSTPLALPPPGEAMEPHGYLNALDDILSTLRSTWQVAPPTNMVPNTAVLTLSCRDTDAQFLLSARLEPLPLRPNTRAGASGYEEDIPIMMSSRANFDMLGDPTPRSQFTAYSISSQLLIDDQLSHRPPHPRPQDPPYPAITMLSTKHDMAKTWTDQVDEEDEWYDTTGGVSTAATADTTDWVTPPHDNQEWRRSSATAAYTNASLSANH